MEYGAPIAHGGALDEARRLYPDAPEPWIDLSTGINPVPYPLPAVAPEVWARLPFESEERALRQAAARRYGAGSGGCITAAPGTQALIQIIPRLVGPCRVAILGPTYEEHFAAWQREGHHVREVDSLAGAQTAHVIVAVNPNNPTGRLIPASVLSRMAEDLAGRDGLLVVDEAFMDVFGRSASLLPELPPATVVLRSFGKTYGLAGLRLGFAIAGRELSSRLRELLGPWAVSGPALAIARRALDDANWLEGARKRLTADASRLDAILGRAGCKVLGGTPLFRLASHREADTIARTLGRHAILVRRFANYPSWLRFGIPGDEAAWRRLEAALAR